MSNIISLIKMFAKLALGRGSIRSYGQNGEDAVVHALTRNISNGIYVDVGAYHPTLYSNTYALYRRGWKGFVIDPNPALRSLFRALRPNDTFINIGIGETTSTRPYFMFSDGAYNTFSSSEAETRKKLPHLQYKGSQMISIVPLRDVLTQNAISRIDVLNVDAEGMDLEILKSHDWKIPPEIILAESVTFNPDSPQSDPVYAYLRRKNYILGALASFTLIFTRAT